MNSESKLKLEKAINAWLDDCDHDLGVWHPDNVARRVADIVENVIDYAGSAAKNAEE